MSLLCVVRDALGSEGVLLSNEHVMCSAGRTGQWSGTPAGRMCYGSAAHWAVKGYSCRMSLLGVVRDELGSEGVLLSDEQ